MSIIGCPMTRGCLFALIWKHSQERFSRLQAGLLSKLQNGSNISDLRTKTTWDKHEVCQKVPKSHMKTKTMLHCSIATRKDHVRMKSYNKDTKSRKFVEGNVIDGKSIAQEMRDEIYNEVEALLTSNPKKRRPHLSVVLVGNDPASIVYVRNKAQAAIETGISCDILRLPHNVEEKELFEELSILNRDETVDGVLVQLPLPNHMSERHICDSILPEKDVDGFNVLNVGRFCVNQEAFIPATPSGVLEILKRLEIETRGKNAVVLGRSKNVGLPIALHLQASRSGDMSAGNATTTICHRHTPPEKLKEFTQNADILISATGVPGLVTAEMVKEGAVVIDIGISRIQRPNGKYRLVGDVDFEGVKHKASLITPVPGGVGPVTVAMVLKNTLVAYKKEMDLYNTFKPSVS